jgi:hypothetical protein
MANDDGLKSFADARAALRDNAKWVLSGTGAVLALVVGGATISQFGSLSPSDWRFWLAVAAGLAGLFCCGFPFRRAITLLTIDLVTMNDFLAAKEGPKYLAYQEIEKRMGWTLTQKSVAGLIREYNAQVDIVINGERQKQVNDASARIAELQPKYDELSQALATEFVHLQFKELMNDLGTPGVAILLLFMVFAWAVNPPKADHTLVAKPFAITIQPDPDSLDLVRPAASDPRCYTPTVRVVVFASGPGGAEDAVLVSPPSGGVCPPLRVSLIDGQLRPAN